MEINKPLQRQLSKYYKSIRKSLPCYNKAMRKMLNDLRLSVESFAEDNPNISFKEIEEHFGEAKHISKEFSAGLSEEYIKTYKIKKYFRIATIAILAAIMLFIGTLTIIIAVNNSRNTVYFYDTTITNAKVLA